MCGIAGFLSGTILDDPCPLGARLSDALAHRGPDGEGFLVLRDGERPACVPGREALAEQARPARGILVHRRLSIVDLETGDQPMRSGAADLWVVFNGEIYNQGALRRDLERAGVTFRTRCDTEVILEVYRAWGLDGFRRLNGMFAFALWDGDAQELVLARDPVGVKPLYWGRGGGGLWFTSELKAPLALDLLARDVDRQRIAEYLYFRFLPAPNTLWSGAHKVVPGVALRFARDGSLVEEREFAPAPGPPSGASVPAIVEQMRGGLAAAVDRQLMSDVPVGAWLSGGLDSSMLVTLMDRLTPGRVPTVAVGFPPSDGRPSELEIARHAATVLHTDHRDRELEAERYFDELPSAIWQADEPLAHPGMLLQQDLSALARERVKVVLTGQGADEPLGGYRRHQAARLATLLGPLRGPASRVPALAARAERDETAARMLHLLRAGDGFAAACAVFSPMGVGDVARWVPGSDAGAVVEPLRRWWDRSAPLDLVGRILYMDVRTSLAEDLLLIGDRMAMRHSLEARVPFLDLDYLRLLEAIPGRTRVRLLASRKHLQYRLGPRVLPPALERKLRRAALPWVQKRGFDVPVTPWFRGSVSGHLPEFLTGRDALLPEYLDRGETRRRVDAYLQGRGEAHRLPLALFVLECWLRMHVGGVAADELPQAWRRDGRRARPGPAPALVDA